MLLYPLVHLLDHILEPVAHLVDGHLVHLLLHTEVLDKLVVPKLLHLDLLLILRIVHVVQLLLQTSYFQFEILDDFLIGSSNRVCPCLDFVKFDSQLGLLLKEVLPLLLELLRRPLLLSNYLLAHEVYLLEQRLGLLLPHLNFPLTALPLILCRLQRFAQPSLLVGGCLLQLEDLHVPLEDLLLPGLRCVCQLLLQLPDLLLELLLLFFPALLLLPELL
mmetsp:Transcript_52963/g.164505  ORF Transcript_52963/g.164505 Transcript_52963/m.164505 type:complete len:219 (-) Transcript_52963:55-711(-)